MDIEMVRSRIVRKPTTQKMKLGSSETPTPADSWTLNPTADLSKAFAAKIKHLLLPVIPGRAAWRGPGIHKLKR